MSHVTCHMLCVTCHLSHVLCHMSHVRCHISDVTRHMSPVASAIVICWQVGNFICPSLQFHVECVSEFRKKLWYMIKEDAKGCEMRGIACEMFKFFENFFIPYI